jgi:hypothetical protein
MRRAIVRLLTGGPLVVALSLAPVASAQDQVTLPPGSSEADQYFEAIPNGGGNGSIDRSRHPNPIPGSADQTLRSRGAEGRAAADLARNTQPPSLGQAKSTAGDGPSWNGMGDGPSSNGMGILLPILLAAILVTAIGYWLRRHLTPT